MADALFDRALELVMDAGQTLLENGGEVFRAQQTGTCPPCRSIWAASRP